MGAPGFERERAALVSRAKAEPIFFIRRPEVASSLNALRLAERRDFEASDFPFRELRRLFERYEHDPAALRDVLLPDGYLYVERPNHAFALVSRLSPERLFAEPHIWVQRGDLVMHAERRANRQYVYVDGPEQGRRVRLLFLDRVGVGDVVPPPLHRDFRSLRYRTFFARARVKHLSEEFITADLLYGEDWVPTLLRAEGARLTVVTEAVDPERRRAVEVARAAQKERAHLVAALRNAMLAQIAEALPFDEPRTEEGQQDGQLRPEWVRAYSDGQRHFEFNGDRYRVYDRDGQPHPPQVCMDFLLDTLDRAAGTWWTPMTAGVPHKTRGRLDLRGMLGSRGRQSDSFIRFALDSPEWFDVLFVPERERIELGYKERFFAWLARRAADFQAGDIVLIRGLTPWDEEEEHTHSFYVFENDPLTGVPIAIAGNAGPANLWSWETEARRTPHRTLRTRVRLRSRWLRRVLPIDLSKPIALPPLLNNR